MTIPFLDLFKRAAAKWTAKMARPVERGPAPPPAPPLLAKPSSERLSKTVMPNVTRSSHRDPFQAAAGFPLPGSQAAPGSAIAFSPSRSRGIQLAPEPKIERQISLELAEIAAQIPAGYLKPIENGEAKRLLSLKNVAPVNYLEYALNNRQKRVQSFEVISSTGQNVFAALNAVSQILLHKFSKQSDAPQTAPLPVAIPVQATATQRQRAGV